MDKSNEFFNRFGPLQIQAIVNDNHAEHIAINKKINDIIDIIKKLSPLRCDRQHRSGGITWDRAQIIVNSYRLNIRG
jgi:hypothetical protein